MVGVEERVRVYGEPMQTLRGLGQYPKKRGGGVGLTFFFFFLLRTEDNRQS